MGISNIIDDKRSLKTKKTTERITLDMGGKALTLFRLTKNATTHTPYWYCRCRIDGKDLQISTKEESFIKAKEIARIWYGGLIAGKDMCIPVENSPRKFDSVAESYIERCKHLVCKEKRNKTFAKDIKIRFKNYLSPFFGKDFINEINTQRINSWLIWRENQSIQAKKILTSEIKKELTILKAILNEAVSKGVIDTLPTLPLSSRIETISINNTTARTYFSSVEVIQLVKAAKRRSNEAEELSLNPPRTGGNYKKIHQDRLYLLYYILWLTGTGMKPGEVQRLRLKDITEYDADTIEECYLNIAIKGKFGDRVANSLFYVYSLFQQMKMLANWNTLKGDDLIFPRSPYKGFAALLEDIGLKRDDKGNTRDAMSLRNYYIMRSLADGEDIFAVSKQCGIDPSIINKHYTAHMNAQQFKDDLINNSYSIFSE